MSSLVIIYGRVRQNYATGNARGFRARRLNGGNLCRSCTTNKIRFILASIRRNPVALIPRFDHFCIYYSVKGAICNHNFAARNYTPGGASFLSVKHTIDHFKSDIPYSESSFPHFLPIIFPFPKLIKLYSIRLSFANRFPLYFASAHHLYADRLVYNRFREF